MNPSTLDTSEPPQKLNDHCRSLPTIIHASPYVRRNHGAAAAAADDDDDDDDDDNDDEDDDDNDPQGPIGPSKPSGKRS